MLIVQHRIGEDLIYLDDRKLNMDRSPKYEAYIVTTCLLVVAANVVEAGLLLGNAEVALGQGYWHALWLAMGYNLQLLAAVVGCNL